MLKETSKATKGLCLLDALLQEAILCFGKPGLVAVGTWAGELVLRRADRRAFLEGSNGVEPSGPGFTLRQLKKEEGQLFLS